MARKLGCWLVVLFAGTFLYAANVGTISGTVKNATGAPQMGAVGEVYTSAATLGATVFTDDHGFYSADNLLPGTYQVKVTAVSFLPALRENVGLRAGAHVLVNVTLTTISDALQSLPARRSERTQPDDWHWTLRYATSRPVLRAVDPGGHTDNAATQAGVREKRDDRSGKGTIALIACSGAEGLCR